MKPYKNKMNKLNSIEEMFGYLSEEDCEISTDWYRHFTVSRKITISEDEAFVQDLTNFFNDFFCGEGFRLIKVFSL